MTRQNRATHTYTHIPPPHWNERDVGTHAKKYNLLTKKEVSVRLICLRPNCLCHPSHPNEIDFEETERMVIGYKRHECWMDGWMDVGSATKQKQDCGWPCVAKAMGGPSMVHGLSISGGERMEGRVHHVPMHMAYGCTQQNAFLWLTASDTSHIPALRLPIDHCPPILSVVCLSSAVLSAVVPSTTTARKKVRRKEGKEISRKRSFLSLLSMGLSSVLLFPFYSPSSSSPIHPSTSPAPLLSILQSYPAYCIDTGDNVGRRHHQLHPVVRAFIAPSLHRRHLALIHLACKPHLTPGCIHHRHKESILLQRPIHPTASSPSSPPSDPLSPQVHLGFIKRVLDWNNWNSRHRWNRRHRAVFYLQGHFCRPGRFPSGPRTRSCSRRAVSLS